MKQLTIEDVTCNLPFDINYGMGDIRLSKSNEKFDFDVWLPSKNMNLQRPLVWTDFQKQELIYSILKKIKLPPISVLKHYKTLEDQKNENYIYQVIDGKQRLTTILSFINNKFSVEWNKEFYFFKYLHSLLQSNFYYCIISNIGYDYQIEELVMMIKSNGLN